MTPSQLNPDTATRPEPFRWTRTEATHTLHDFHANHTSQRYFAQQAGVPRSTLQYWQQQRQYPDLESELAVFLESAAGYRFLRRLILALHLVFHLAGHAGLRLLGDFLRLSQLDQFVAASYGSQQAFASHLQDELITFASEERQCLGAIMPKKSITACLDENFHGAQICLVAVEPLSNFILVEAYHEHRDGQTWTVAIQQALQGVPVEVIQITSDLAQGLLACAHTGLDAQHSPDVFHVQHELTGVLSLSLQRQTDAAAKELAEKQRLTLANQQEQQRYEQGPRPAGRAPDWATAGHWHAVWEQRAQDNLLAAQTRQEESRQAVRGLADDYHPFDQVTGQEVTAEQVQQRLHNHLAKISAVVTTAGLRERAREAVARVQRWLPLLVATIAWFWNRVHAAVQALAVSAAAETAIYQQLLPGLYWEEAAKRGRDKEQVQQRRLLAKRLLEQAWSPAGPLSKLTKEEQAAVKRMASSVQGLFCRSSSCVEGRNGHLSLYHHGQGALSDKRLQALTAVHNYVVQRNDGTTAAERFFGSKQRDVFAWLLERLPEWPRPVKKAKKATEPPQAENNDWPNP